MAQTWDTSRVGGGTYEFVQDAQGHYKLQSVGFEKLNKLNLPELKAEATTTAADTTKAAATVSAQTKQAFGDVQPFYYNQEGGADTSPQYTMRKEGDLSTETQPMVTGDTFAQARQKMTTDAAYTGKPDLTKLSPEITLPGTPKWAQGADKRGYENIGKEVKPTNQIGRQNVDQVLAARKDPNRFGPGQWGPKPSAGMPTTRIPDRITSPLRPAIKKPKPTEVVTTQLKKVNTALGPLAKAVGFIINPVKGLVGAAAGMVTETPTQKHAKKYFNADDQTGRISGNPATDLYAGMNRVSAMGNLERAGERRIETREKTIEKKGYGPGDKFYDDTQKMKDQQKNYKDSKDNNVVDKGFTRTRAERKASPGRQDREGGGNGGGNGGGRVICTELHRTHELSTKDWIRDVHFTFNTLTENHIKGYLIWAIPTVKHMKKYPKYRKIWKHIAQHRANDIAWRLNEGKFDLLGRIYAGIGEPLCWLIGNFTGNKQINELNIKNWRKA